MIAPFVKPHPRVRGWQLPYRDAHHKVGVLRYQEVALFVSAFPRSPYRSVFYGIQKQIVRFLNRPLIYPSQMARPAYHYVTFGQETANSFARLCFGGGCELGCFASDYAYCHLFSLIARWGGLFS